SPRGISAGHPFVVTADPVVLESRSAHGDPEHAQPLHLAAEATFRCASPRPGHIRTRALPRLNSSTFSSLCGRLPPYSGIEPIFMLRCGAESAMVYSYRKAVIRSTRDARRAGK